MSSFIFNDEDLFVKLNQQKRNERKISLQNVQLGYRIAFFHFLTIKSQSSYIAFSDRDTTQKSNAKFDVYFLFRTLLPDGIILYRHAQDSKEYFVIGLQAGNLVLFIDFAFGKRKIVTDHTIKLTDGKWHEVQVHRVGLDKFVHFFLCFLFSKEKRKSIRKSVSSN